MAKLVPYLEVFAALLAFAAWLLSNTYGSKVKSLQETIEGAERDHTQQMAFANVENTLNMVYQSVLRSEVALAASAEETGQIHSSDDPAVRQVMRQLQRMHGLSSFDAFFQRSLREAGNLQHYVDRVAPPSAIAMHAREAISTLEAVNQELQLRQRALDLNLNNAIGTDKRVENITTEQAKALIPLLDEQIEFLNTKVGQQWAEAANGISRSFDEVSAAGRLKLQRIKRNSRRANLAALLLIGLGTLLALYSKYEGAKAKSLDVASKHTVVQGS